MVRLVKLIAALGIVQQEREVREEIEIVRDAVRAQFRGGVAARALPLDRPAVAIGIAAVSGIEGSKAADDALPDRADGYLIR